MAIPLAIKSAENTTCSLLHTARGDKRTCFSYSRPWQIPCACLREVFLAESILLFTSTNSEKSAASRNLISGELIEIKMKIVIICVLTIISTAYAATNQMRWCTISTYEEQKCVDMITAFSNNDLSPEVVCVPGSDTTDCIMKIEDGEADLMNLGGNDMYLAGKEYGLVPIIQEKYETEPYHGIAVVRATDTHLSFNNLEGKDSCHTGVRRTAGWIIPVGFLMDSGYMTPTDCGDDINAVANYFNQSCAPGAYTANNDPYGRNPASLCAICTNKQCPPDSSELYQSYSGAFRCLAEGAGDVAFIKPVTITENTDGGGTEDWNRDLNSADFRLLCPDNTQSTTDDYENCHLAQRASDAIATSSSKSAEDIEAFQDVLEKAVALFGDDNNLNGFKMFDSAAYGGSNLLFSDSAQDLENLESGLTYQTYLGEYANSLDGLNMCPPNTLRWCTTSPIETLKCRDMSAAFKEAGLTPVISCYEEESSGHCVDRIVSGDADAVTLDGGDLYEGGDKIVPVAGESYDVGGEDADASYWAVAVARVGTEFGIDELENRKSCHTGIGKTSGWNVPAGHLIKQGHITVNDDCDVPLAVGEFFSGGSCAPGAKTPQYDPFNTNPSSLCDLCIGTGSNNCVRNANEPYYDYAGAFRCLAEEKGDVAFVKHATVPDNTDGNGNEDWSMNLRSEDYELLCADNTRQPVTEWRTCNLAKVPSHAVVTSADKTAAQRQEILDLLLSGQNLFGSDTGSGFKMFDSGDYDDTDLLFKDSTQMLVDVGSQDTTREWLSEEYVEDLDALYCADGGATKTVEMSLVVTMLAFLIQTFWVGVLTSK